MKSRKPSLMLPAGERDYRSRLIFLEAIKDKLEDLGWCVGIEWHAKELNRIAARCFEKVLKLGGRITWHPPANELYGLGYAQNAIAVMRLCDIVGQARAYSSSGIEAIVLHAAPACEKEPSTLGFDRFRSPVSAKEMMVHLQQQVKPLRIANEESCGLLHLENLDICTFGGGGYTLPTYLALQGGAWLDLAWLKDQTGCKTCFDSEHFFGSRNFLLRESEYRGLRDEDKEITCTDKVMELQKITGYYLEKGSIPLVKEDPISKQQVSSCTYIDMVKPNLFHIGGAHRAAFGQLSIASHLPFTSFDTLHPSVRATIQHILTLLANGQGIGAVIEVCGMNEPGEYSPWSNRIQDTDIAKFQTYLAVLDQLPTSQMQ